MSAQVRLSEEIIYSAKIFGEAEGREANQQIEYWAKIGKMAIANPDLSFQVLRGVLMGMAEYKAGEVSDFELEIN